MAFPDTDLDWVNYLTPLHFREHELLRPLNDEYELRSPRMYMHPEIFREIGDRLQQVVIAWPQLVVDSIEERLDVEGFRLPDEDAADDDLWRVWQENNLDEESQLAHIDALVMKRSYLAIGTNEDDDNTPLVTVESPLEVFADIDPRTRRVRAALRWWQDAHNSLVRTPEKYVTLYLPDRTVFYDNTNGLKEIDRDDHKLGQVPVVPITNRARLADRYGHSELTPILPLAHAANKIATDMMVAAEFVALPLRGLFGIGPEDLEDPDGNRLSALQAILGRLLTVPGDASEVRHFEFSSAQLSNFHETINQLAKLTASIAGLPPHNLGIATDNPVSADAIRSAEARLIKRAERKQRAFGGSYETAMRLIRRFQSGEWDPRLKRLETIWRDASTPTTAQKADAAVKLFAAGIVSRQQTLEDLGYSQATISRILAEHAEAAQQAAASDPFGDFTPAPAATTGQPAADEPPTVVPDASAA